MGNLLISVTVNSSGSFYEDNTTDVTQTNTALNNNTTSANVQSTLAPAPDLSVSVGTPGTGVSADRSA